MHTAAEQPVTYRCDGAQSAEPILILLQEGHDLAAAAACAAVMSCREIRHTRSAVTVQYGSANRQSYWRNNCLTQSRAGPSPACSLAIGQALLCIPQPEGARPLSILASHLALAQKGICYQLEAASLADLAHLL